MWQPVFAVSFAVGFAVSFAVGVEVGVAAGQAEKSGAQRLKINDLDVTRRATRGILIAKKNKTNPHSITLSIAGSLNDSLNIMSDEGLLPLKCKDVSLLNKESRFSNPLTNRNWYHVNGIEEARVVDIPADQPKKSYEEIQLEV
mgnify:CR=1 FL=1